jgi:hypothetical protein
MRVRAVMEDGYSHGDPHHVDEPSKAKRNLAFAEPKEAAPLDIAAARENRCGDAGMNERGQCRYRLIKRR